MGRSVNGASHPPQCAPRRSVDRTDSSHTTVAAATALHAPIRSLPGLYTEGVESGRSPIRPNALEPPGFALSGHFLIEIGGVTRVRRKQTFQAATMLAPGWRGPLTSSHPSPTGDPTGRTRAAPDRANYPRSAAPLASGRAAA